jgi:hypothetical protein
LVIPQNSFERTRMRKFIISTLCSLVVAEPSLVTGVEIQQCGSDICIGSKSMGGSVCAEISDEIFAKYPHFESYGTGTKCVCVGAWSYLVRSHR